MDRIGQDIDFQLVSLSSFVSCGQVVRWDSGGPVTVEGRHHVLPESYSPPAARSSWEDRDLWRCDWTKIGPADSHSEPTAALRPTWPYILPAISFPACKVWKLVFQMQRKSGDKTGMRYWVSHHLKFQARHEGGSLQQYV